MTCISQGICDARGIYNATIFSWRFNRAMYWCDLYGMFAKWLIALIVNSQTTITPAIT
jgi:hypothetical protein